MEVMTAKEVAELLRVSPACIRMQAKNGKLPFNCIKVGSAYRFSKTEVMNFINGGINDNNN